MLNRQEKRLNRIIKMLGLSNPTTVNKIASVMEVSHMTIRRDLEVLKDKNMVDIFHGGVVLKEGIRKNKHNPYSLSYANKQMNAEKKNIAVKATSYVNSKDTIIIDTGSTIEYFARSLPEGLSMTVICFTINSLLHISKLKKTKIIFPGGYFHENTLMFESEESRKLIENNPANTAFISASGISLEKGVSCSNDYELSVKKEMLNLSEKKILLVDSSKFNKVHSTLFAKITDFDIIISDSKIPEEYKKYCKKNSIELILV